jgi:repressor LexA
MKSAEHTHESRRLTPRQLEILTYVRDYRRSHGYSPTMQELADSLHITKVTVFEHVGALERKGLLRRLPHKARSLEPTDLAEFPDEVAGGIPLVGHIAAGHPIEAIENREIIELKDMFPAREGTFLLRVRGDSMIDEQIRDGDYVVVEKRSRVKDGDVVVALLEDGDATLKKLYRDKKHNRYRLQPANPEFEPTFVDRLDVQGVVVGVLRKFG